MSPRILGVVPARGGSKGVPNKNVRLLGGRPLILHTVAAARRSNYLTDLIVSTDSDEIAEICRNDDVTVPFMRPAALATDDARAIPTIQHAVRTFEHQVGYEYDWVMMLQPTAPLRSSNDIDDACFSLLQDSEAESVVSVTRVDNYHPQKMKIIREGAVYDYVPNSPENPPRQSLSPVYIVNGAIYLFTREALMLRNSFKGSKCLPLVMPAERSVNIDSITDFLVAEYYLNSNAKHD